MLEYKCICGGNLFLADGDNYWCDSCEREWYWCEICDTLHARNPISHELELWPILTEAGKETDHISIVFQKDKTKIIPKY